MTFPDPDLVAFDALITEAEAELARHKRRLEQAGGPAPAPSDPFDPISCLELWLKALRRCRAQRLLGVPAEPMPRPTWLH